MKTLEDRIATLQLTKKERVLADYILAHQDGIGLTTARGLAQAVAMTDTTVIRFLRKLGFTGFVDFRQQMNARMVEQLKNPGDVNLSPGKNMRRPLRCWPRRIWRQRSWAALWRICRRRLPNWTRRN